MKKLSILHTTEVKRTTWGDNSSRYRLLIQGPLYSSRELSKCSLVIDVSKRDKILTETTALRVVPLYRWLRPYTVVVMGTEEMLAEKVRAMLTRTVARDLCDVHFLLAKGDRINSDLNRKRWNIMANCGS